MTGGYLKQLQLTKQLEQQAKKATKNREAAESKLSESEELIASAKGIEANVTKAEKLLVEGSHAFSRKDYKGALSLAVSSIEEARASKSSRVESVLSSTQDLLDHMGDLTKEAREPESAIAKARELIGEDQLDEAYAQANSAWDLTERFINSRMADEFERAQSLLLLTEGEGLDTESDREQLGHARRALENGDFVESLEDLRSSLDSIGDALTNLFKRRSTEIENGIESIDIDVDFQRVGELLDRAKERLEEGDMEEGLSNLTIAEGEFRKSFTRALLSAFDSLQERRDLLTGYGEDLPEIDDSLPRGRDLAREGELWDALDICREMIGQVRDRELEVILEQMLKLKPKLQIARRTGSDITNALVLLEDSRKTMRNGDFQSAVDLVHQADAVLEEELKGFREVERELDRTEELLGYAEMYDLEMKGAMDSMKAARGLALNGNIPESLDHLKGAQRELDRGIQQHLGSEIMRIELLLASAMRMDTDVSKESVMIDEVMERVRKGDYKNVEEPMEKCRLKMKDFLEENAETALENARKMLDRYDGMADVTPSRLVLEEAASAYENRDFDSAFRLAGKAVDDLERQESDVLDKGLREARRLTDISRTLGEESSAINERLARAESLRLDGRTKESIEVTQEVIQLTGSVVRESIWKGLESLTRSITSAHKKGVEVVKIEKLAEGVSRSLERECVADSYDTLREAEEELRTILDHHREVTDLVKEIGSLLEEARANGIDATGAEQLFHQTKLLLDSGEYHKAIELARKTMKEAESQTASVMAPRRLQELKNLLATGRRMELDMSTEETKVEDIQRMLDSGDHAGALATTQGIRRAIRDRIVEKLESDIARSREMIGHAREVGADVTALDNIVDRGEKLLSAGRINDAMRAVDLVRKELDQGMIVERKANEGIGRASSVISNVRKAGMEPAGAMEILRQARDQAQAGRAGIALELAKKATDQAADTARSKLMENFKKMEMSQRAMEIEGPDLAQASRMKNDFKRAMEEWKFTQAVGLLKNIEEEISRVERQKNLTTRTIAETETRVEEARERGLISEKVERLLEDARERMGEGMFSSAFSVAIRCRDELRSMEDLYDRRIGDLKKLRDRLQHASEEGVDVNEAGELFDKAEEFLSKLDFEEASLHLSRGDTTLRKSMGRYMESRRRELNDLYRTYCDMSLEGEEVQSVLKLVERKRFRMEDFDLLIGCMGALKERILDGMETLSGEISGKMQVASNSGADTSTSEELLAQTRKLMAEGKLSEAYMTMRESEGSIGVAMEERREYMELRMRCESLIENARRNGLVMNEVIGIFARAENEKGSSYSMAIETMRSALGKAEEAAAAYLPDLAIDIDFLDEPHVNQWMRTHVVVKNESKAMARDVRMTLTGEVDVKGLETIKKLRGNESIELEFEMLPSRKGKIGVEFSLSCRPVLSDDSFGFDSGFELDVK